MLKTDKNSPSEIYHSIIEGDIEKAHNLIKAEDVVDLSSHSFRAVDLRALSLENKKINFGNCYFKNTDLRGLDLAKSNLSGASLHNARISGVIFPNNISASEIELSVIRGTRLRPNV